LSRRKRDVRWFFQGTGTPERLFADLTERVANLLDGISKFEIACTVVIH
jgi:hypothetical protein